MADVSTYKDVKYDEVGCICFHAFSQISSPGHTFPLFAPFPKIFVTHGSTSLSSCTTLPRYLMQRDLKIAPNSFLIDTETTDSESKISRHGLMGGITRQNTCYRKAPGKPIRNNSMHTEGSFSSS